MQRGGRNSILAGAFVIVSVVAGLAVVVLLGGLKDVLGTTPYTVRFPLDPGAKGIKPGSPVEIGGQPVGVVRGVAFVRDNGAPRAIDVTIAIDNDLILREGAVAWLELPLLGTQGSINFEAVGDGAPLDATTPIDARIAPPGFLESAGFGPEESERVGSILATLDTLDDDLRAAAAAVRAVAADARDRWPTWRDRFDRITDNADRTIERGPALAADLEKILDDIEAGIQEGRDALALVRDDYEGDWQPKISDAASNVQELADYLNERARTVGDRVAELVDKGHEAVDDAQAVMDDARATYFEQRPNVQRTLANLRLTSDQLRDTIAEVRRTPWRLLYRPTDRELNFELLYDAARAYAGAVAELRAAASSFESAAAGDARLAEERVTELLDRLGIAAGGLEEAERMLLDLLRAQAGP